jgi:hypothetical protein
LAFGRPLTAEEQQTIAQLAELPFANLDSEPLMARTLVAYQRALSFTPEGSDAPAADPGFSAALSRFKETFRKQH